MENKWHIGGRCYLVDKIDTFLWRKKGIGRELVKVKVVEG